MPQPTDATLEEVHRLRALLQEQQTSQNELRNQIQVLTTSIQSNLPVQLVQQNEPINPGYTSENSINISLFKTLPEFNGNRNQYRSWRSQAKFMMDSISAYMNTTTYYQALTIVRNKITGQASDILVTHNTTFNFNSIINRLDYAFNDQRNITTLMDEIRRSYQGKQSLSEYHSRISQIINQVMVQIEIKGGRDTYAAQLMMDEAVRNFCSGLNNKNVASTILCQHPRDLETAYTMALSCLHDVGLINDKQGHRPTYNPDHRIQPRNFNPIPRVEPMDTYERPSFNRQRMTAPPQNYQPQTFRNNYERQRSGLPPQNPDRGDTHKRDRQASSFNFNPQKQQRINQIEGESDKEVCYSDQEDDINEPVIDDDTSTAFLC